MIFLIDGPVVDRVERAREDARDLVLSDADAHPLAEAQAEVVVLTVDIGDEGLAEIGQSLLPLFEIEGARLDDNDRTAVALAVAETFNKAKISSELLAEH